MSNLRDKAFKVILKLLTFNKMTQEQARQIRETLPSDEKAHTRLEAIQMMSTRGWDKEEALRAMGIIAAGSGCLMLAHYCRHSKLVPIKDIRLKIFLAGGLN